LAKPIDLIRGTLDLLILKTLALGPMHGWAVGQRIEQVSNGVLLIQQGSLPASRAAALAPMRALRYE
jgi:hypothetical protein